MKLLLLSLFKTKSAMILFLFISSIFVTIDKSSTSSLTEINNHKMKMTSLGPNIKNSNQSPLISSSIRSSTINEDQIPFTFEQNTSINLNSRSLFSINSSETSNIRVESTPQSSSFIVQSVPSEEKSSWKNNIEPDYGEVEIFQNLTTSSPYFHLNFSENNVTPVSGITNIDFNVTANPSPSNYSTEFLFEYRVPSIDSALMNEIHSLVLELRFNNATLNFIIVDKGSYFGDALEENIYKPSTNSLYIMCNETDQSNWIIESFNITRLITQFFLPSEYSMFMQLTAVFCYMFAFIPDFEICLDIMEINYTTSLPPNECAVTYTIGESVIQSENGSMKYEFCGDSFSIEIEENSLWKDHQITKFLMIITRNRSDFIRTKLIYWNQSYVQVNLNLSFPQFFFSPLSSLIFITLPLDWILFDEINGSVPFEVLRISEIPPDNISGYLYRFSITNQTSLLLQCYIPNSIKNIEAPTIISYYEIVQVVGSLIQPSTGILHLYLMNQTVFYHETTLCMLNGSFIFPMINIDNHYPLGIINLLINLSSTYQYGIYQQLVHIHSGEITTDRINLFTSEHIEIYQYDHVYLNLSLEKNGEKYVEESTMVILVTGEHIYELNQSVNGFFSLTLIHVIWPPQQSNLTIIASNGGEFFASRIISITIFPITVDWDIQGVPVQLYPQNNLSLQVNLYVSPIEGGTNWPLSGVNLMIWINSTLIQECQTNFFGYVDVLVSTGNYVASKLLNLVFIAKIENIILKMTTFSISIANETNRYHPYLNEVMKAPIVNNRSFFHIYNVRYPVNGSLWFISSDNYQGTPISAYLLRNDFVLKLEITDQMLSWELISDLTNNDTLILEFPGPLTIFTVSEESSSFDIHIECFSNFTISNYTLILDLDFINFPLNKITLRDFLRRDMTDKFDFELIDSQIHLKQLSIIKGIMVNYYLEIQFDTPKIEILTNFKEAYAYNELIIGKWRFITSSEFSYIISYTISNEYRSECRNTTITSFENNTFIIKAFFEKFKWNSSVTVTMKVIFSNGAVSTSPEQIFTITDPYPPDYSYYLESSDTTINLHVIIFEPESASGIRNIICTYFGIQYNLSILKINHYLYEIPSNNTQFGVLDILISDWAGNENFISINLKLDLEFPTTRENFDLSIFLPSIFSLMTICGIFVFKFIRKRQSSIL